MNLVLRDLTWKTVLVFLDDILLLGKREYGLNCTAIRTGLIQMQNDQKKVIGRSALTQIRGDTVRQGKNRCQIRSSVSVLC